MKAVALISGGLDSMLAARVVKDQGIEVIGLHFDISFGRHKKRLLGLHDEPIHWVEDNLGIELRTVDIAYEFLEVLKSPKHGYGANMNPCIDCKILMLKKSKEIMHDLGASFVITGEVLGQRPMSQHRQALMSIEKESGLEGLLLRPLSAKLLPLTTPEVLGWIDRAQLLRINGRSRKDQKELISRYDIKDYPNAAGGCLLTDPEFSRRLQDLMKRAELNVENVELIKVGRYLKISENSRLIVGRDEKENEFLTSIAKDGDYLFMPANVMGPAALGRGDFDENLINLACRIVCRYCDLNSSVAADIIYKKKNSKEESMNVTPAQESEIERLRI
ncbi:MAG: tRNA 4-thiouridine(8) synthase ThiI [Candidatus Omnitrophota bacterium]